MAKLDFVASDLATVKTLLSALKRGKWELEGEEILAFAQAYHWAGSFHGGLSKALDEEARAAAAAAALPRVEASAPTEPSPAAPDAPKASSAAEEATA